MRKILFALIGCFAVFCAHAAQVVNVDYVHKLIAQKWDISIPIKTNNIMAVANMKYLLTAVDVANEILNGEKTTDYGNGEFATLQVADTVATNTAVETLVKQNKIEYKFFIDIDLSKYDDNDLGTTTITEFGFDISAAGTFYIDWGDGTTETIKKADTNPVTYSHDYGTATGVFRVGIGGRATDYSDDTYTSVLNFLVTLGPMSESYQAITNIDGSLGAIFGTLADGSQPSFFTMFDATQGVKKIPDNLFKGIHGDLVDGMFQGTFSSCYALTGPSARIDGLYLYEIWPDATSDQVGTMYYDATGLSDYRCIPVAWGGGGEDCDSSSSTPSVPEDAVYDFYLTTTSDTDVFAMQISAAGEFYIDWGDGKTEWVTKSDTTNMGFGHKYASKGAYNIKLGGQATAYNTSTSTAAISFYVNSSQTKIASIDGSLGAIFGTLADGTQPRFYQTFYYATNMTGLIPSNLFAGISGAPASYMFSGTFEGCSGLTSIPAGLFAGISGAPASYMFASTFEGCSGLTGAIPDGLFGNLTGAPAERMFSSTFNRCRGLTSIPENLFGNISGTAQSGMFIGTFLGCTSLTGPSARINGQYLYEIWPDDTSDQVNGMYYDAKGLSDYLYIPVEWGGLGATTNEYPSAPSDAVYDFYLTTTSDTDMFAMQISAAGEFYIDWGDGKSEWITKSDTTNMTFGHKYASKGAYNIRLGGQATAYNTNTSTAAISFSSSASKIASIDGSLGAIFGTLSSDTNNQPRFYQTFNNASNMKGAIPENLFAGISGAPAFAMFMSTFDGCSKLTSIPENLFGNISGTAQSNMFYRTFYNCTSLTGPSARINGQYLYKIWPSATSGQVGYMYYNATGLSDYSTMPTVWKY